MLGFFNCSGLCCRAFPNLTLNRKVEEEALRAVGVVQERMRQTCVFGDVRPVETRLEVGFGQLHEPHYFKYP